jgi:hypothetical protein
MVWEIGEGILRMISSTSNSNVQCDINLPCICFCWRLLLLWSVGALEEDYSNSHFVKWKFHPPFPRKTKLHQ